MYISLGFVALFIVWFCWDSVERILDEILDFINSFK